MTTEQAGDDLDRLQRSTFDYFWTEARPDNGLIRDNTSPEGPPVSIAGVGMALSSYPPAVARSYVSRHDAALRVRGTLKFFFDSPQGPEPDATGHRGFYYHFLDDETGRRTWGCELSTIDTAILIAGMLTAAAFFDGDDPVERELRELADACYLRVDWNWAQDGGTTVSHGWRPESGFLPRRWNGYNEAAILYLLGLGSPTHPLHQQCWAAWCKTYEWRELYGIAYLHGAPLFVHQLSHLWIDFRGIRDAAMRPRGMDYFENSRRAAYIQRAYAMENPHGFRGYGANAWGITASSGPGPKTRTVDGVRRRFFGYHARGAPDGPDDGTLAPWATIASLPFAPELVFPALRHFQERWPEMVTEHGVTCSFNPTFTTAGHGWVSGGHYALDQGPVVVMIENYRSGLVWRLMRRCPYVVTGLRRAGFMGGWLGSAP